MFTDRYQIIYFWKIETSGLGRDKVRSCYRNLNFQLSCDVTKPTNWPVRPAKTQISLGIRPVWSESLLWGQWVDKGPSFHHADSEDWSDWVDAQADLSLRWARKPFCWFCQDAAQLFGEFSWMFTPEFPSWLCQSDVTEPGHDKTCLWEFPTRPDTNRPAQP